ncbi:IPT/TIG domain-containing protein [Embleya sp. NPDC059237]|uniref:IPT/TIG domain-containing protein n=1 Tax=Embleya sp. NPDC059237 TaxID=3346784 RepID=UPI00369B601E
MSDQALPSAAAPVAMTLAAIAASAAPSRPSGETLSQHANRVFLGIQQQLADASLATANSWSLQWIALSPDNANMAYLVKNKNVSVNEFAVVIRGTVASETDMLEDLGVGTVVPFTAVGSPPKPVWVAEGAMEAFTQIVTMDSVGVTLVQALAYQFTKAPPNPTVRVIGHSLGGCIATMIAPYLLAQPWSDTTPRFALHTFAAPTAGGADFAAYVDSLPFVANERYYNTFDLVPQAWNALAAAKDWYPDPPGPAATNDVKAIIGTLAGLPGPHVYVQPGTPCALNPRYGIIGSFDPYSTRKSLQDFMAQVAYQHANSTYLYWLGAPNVLPGPVVTSISPNVGPPGTTVVITGTGLGIGSANTKVDFGTLPCPRFGVSDDGTQITVYLPLNMGTGVVPVRVTTNLGTSPAVAAARFAYDGPAPVAVTGINPRAGAKKTRVTITGENFGSDAEVYFGDNIAEVLPGTQPTQIVALAPAPTLGPTDPGTVNVTVVSNGYSSPAGPGAEYTYPE